MINPQEGIAVTNSLFANAILSSEPSNSIWVSPTFVTMPAVGSAILANSAISPNPRIPISTTAAWWSQVRFNNVNGKPISLLKFASVFNTEKRLASTAAVKSFVVVFPFDPVMAMTGKSKRRLWKVARFCKAWRVSATVIIAAVLELIATARCTNIPAAPCVIACSTNSCPSNRSPARATNRSPGLIRRVSVQTPVNCLQSVLFKLCPPVAKQTSLTVNSAIISSPL